MARCRHMSGAQPIERPRKTSNARLVLDCTVQPVSAMIAISGGNGAYVGIGLSSFFKFIEKHFV